MIKKLVGIACLLPAVSLCVTAVVIGLFKSPIVVGGAILVLSVFITGLLLIGANE